MGGVLPIVDDECCNFLCKAIVISLQVNVKSKELLDSHDGDGNDGVVEVGVSVFQERTFHCDGVSRLEICV